MVDILAIAAHPDDVELNIAGTLLKASDAGQSFAICDLTQGERGTRGSMKLRQAESDRANKVLGIDPEQRWNLDIPDGDIRLTEENRLKVVRAIRHFRPKIILFPWERDRHPDHENTNKLVREAYFDAGLTHIKTSFERKQQEPHRPHQMYTFFQAYEEQPDFIVDISDQFERKLKAIAAYSTQFTVPGQSNDLSEEKETFISGTDFMEFIIARMRHWGFMIGAKYGEAYNVVGTPLKVENLLDTI